MSKFLATIKWLDDDTTQEEIIKVGDMEENEDVFYYVDSEKDIEDLKKPGINDFVVVDAMPIP